MSLCYITEALDRVQIRLKNVIDMCCEMAYVSGCISKAAVFHAQLGSTEPAKLEIGMSKTHLAVILRLWMLKLNCSLAWGTQLEEPLCIVAADA